MDEREANLPKWAQALIADLRKQVQDGKEPLATELNTLRPRMKLLTARHDAMKELLECAAHGGHVTAKTIIDTIGEYDLVIATEPGQP